MKMKSPFMVTHEIFRFRRSKKVWLSCSKKSQITEMGIIQPKLPEKKKKRYSYTLYHIGYRYVQNTNNTIESNFPLVLKRI